MCFKLHFPNDIFLNGQWGDFCGAETGIFQNKLTKFVADAVAPCAAWISATDELIMLDKRIPVFHNVGFQQPVPP